jgi:uridylate kinase
VIALKIVVKIGGYAFPSELDTAGIEPYAMLFSRLHREDHELLVVTGGGEDARKYIRVARALGANEAYCDQIGIEVTRLNARLFISKLGGEAHPDPPTNIHELTQALATGKIVVMGGLTPGHSTDAVAALAAELMHADVLIRTTDVNGVYTGDPKKDPKVKRLDVISSDKLLKMVLSGEFWAGCYELLDPVAVKIIARSKIPTWIIDGKEPANIEKIVRGKTVGTRVTVEA